MNVKVISCIIAFFSTISFYSQLSGFAYLNGQADHSGIKVKFNAHPGTAVNDSVFTASSGSYSINITGGVYDVVLTRAGYIPVNYNNGASIVLTNSVVLNSNTLNPGNAVIVSGNVSGNWTNNNTYIINGNITIPSGTTLSIQPGTTIKFNGYYSILGNGVLVAIGTSSSPILFTSNLANSAPGNWNKIEIKNSASIIDKCILEYAMTGINCTGNSPIISNNIFRNISTIGIYCNNCGPQIIGNQVYDIVNTSGSGAIGIWVEVNACCALIECNQIHHCISTSYNAYGIISGSNYIKNNVIHDISGGVGYGIQSRGSNSKVENNYIYKCNSGINLDSNWPPYLVSPLLLNNTIDNNMFGLMLSGGVAQGYNPSIVNNVITNNQYGIYQLDPSPAEYNVSYNLVWNNSNANYSNVQITGVGAIVGNNQQGNQIDSYFNLSQNPLFVANTPPQLSLSSPCINAGNVSYSTKIGYENSISCPEIANGVTELFKQNISLRIFPNPSSSVINISNTQNQIDASEIEIINALGESVKRISYSNSIDVSNISEGFYSLKILNSNNQQIYYCKFIKQ